jgi:cell division protein FtsB
LALEARRADLERRIRIASSRQVLVPQAQRQLGLHEPGDSEFVLFALPVTGPEKP